MQMTSLGEHTESSRAIMAATAAALLAVCIVLQVLSATEAQVLQTDLPCVDKNPDAAYIKKMQKYYCISQCMGGFGGEINFCRSDGICPSE